MKRFLWKLFGWHSWRYRNPFDRVCTTCGRKEVVYCFVGESRVPWWEVFDDGDPAKHYEPPGSGPSRNGGSPPS